MLRPASTTNHRFLDRALLFPLFAILSLPLLLSATPPAEAELPPQIVPPVPPPAEPGSQPSPGLITQISKTKYRLGKIEFEKNTRTITFDATLNMNKGMLEYALVTKTGKVHEALLATEISPFNLNLALLVLNYKPAENFIPSELLSPDKQPAPGAKPSPIDQSNGFDIKISWIDPQGIKKTARIEDWVHNDATKKKAERSPFVYTGSQLDNNGIYAAQSTGSIIALYSDPLAMFNSPRKGNDSDEIWTVEAGVPPLLTKVQIILSPHEAPAKEPKEE